MKQYSSKVGNTKKYTSIWRDFKFCEQHDQGLWRRHGVLAVLELTREFGCMGLGSHIKYLIYSLLSSGSTISKYK